MSDIRFNQWLHQSGTGGVSQDHIGNIGIGTTNPSIVVSAANTAVLNVGVITANNLFVNNAFNGDITGNVTGNISGATGTFSGNVDIADKIIHTGDTDTAMRFPADNTFAVDTAGTERLRITSAGLIGIGTVSPSGPIHAHVASGTQRSYFEASAAHSFLRLKSGSTSYNSGLEFFSGASNIANITGLGAGGLLFEVNGSERLRVDATGRVGINTTTYSDVRDSLIVAPPSGQTDVFFTIKTLSTNGNTRLQFADPDDTNVGDISYTHSNNAMVFKTADTERLRIDSAGRFMLGTTTEGFATYGDNLTIADSGHCGLTIRSGTSSYGTIYFSDGDDGSADEVRGFLDYNHSTNTLQLGTNGSTRFRIASDGQATFEKGAPGGANQVIARFQAESARRLDIVWHDSGSLLGFDLPGSHSYIFKTAGTERMRIGSDGKFYYATTSQGPHGGFFNIDASSSGRNGMNVKGTTANYAYISSAGGSSGDHIHFSNYSNSNQETGRIKDNQSNVTYYTSSDYRLKDNIVSITDGITRVKQLNPVRHTWINNPALGTVDGWIAHELDAVCPDAVDGEKDAVREDGSIEPQAADYGRITPLLAAALKELIAKVETLEAAVTALQGS